MKNQEDVIKITRIYLVSNCYNDPNMVYIGKEKSHQKRSRKFSHKKKYGIKSNFEYIDEINSWDIIQWEPLECFWIQHFKNCGYELMNKNKGGNGPSFHTQETKEKMSKSSKGKAKSEDHKQKISNATTGKILSQETKDKISKSKMGVKLSQETRDKISKSMKGVEWNEIQNISRSKKLLGRIITWNHKITGRIGVEVIQFDLKGNFIKLWDNIRTASLQLNIDDAGIVNCCKGKHKTCGGFLWKYKDPKTNSIYL